MTCLRRSEEVFRSMDPSAGRRALRRGRSPDGETGAWFLLAAHFEDELLCVRPKATCCWECCSFQKVTAISYSKAKNRYLFTGDRYGRAVASRARDSSGVLYSWLRKINYPYKITICMFYQAHY